MSFAKYVAFVALLTAVGAASGQEQPAEVRPNAEIQFQQDRAQAHMRELEERMFRLANLIREAQPDDSARLLMGVQRAREQLISDHMAEASQLLEALHLDQASGRQAEIIEKLEELKRLLLSADIDLELKLEQLRKLRDARVQLEKLIAQEQSQFDQTLAQVELTAPNPADLETLEQFEQRNQRAAEDLAQFVMSFGPSTAGGAGALGSASESMSNAANQLGKSEAKNASEEQLAALEKLKEAELNLRQAEESLRKELEALVRQQVMENLSAMIVQQRQVRDTTEKLSPRVSARQEQALVATRRLAESEDEILVLCEDSLDLAELTEFSMVLPMALQAVSEKISGVGDALRNARADEPLIADEKEIESDLQQLLDALKQASRPNFGPSSLSGTGGEQNINKLLGEIRMLRWMQSSLHVRTAKLDKQDLPDAERQTLAAPLTARQSEIRDITRRLNEEFGGGS